MKNVSVRTKEELKALRRQIDEEIEKLEREEFVKRTLTREELLKIFRGFGYQIPSGSRFWRILSGDHRGCYGFEVGRYTHSCHVDTTDFVVLLVYSEKYNTIVDSFDELSLKRPITV